MKKKKILVICPFPIGVAAGQRLKYEQYFDSWEKAGFDVEVSNFMNLPMWDIVYSRGNFFKKVLGTLRGYGVRVFDVFRLKNADIIYIFLWVTPFGTSFFERLFRLFAKKIIYDIEDNLFIENGNDINPFVKLLKSKDKTNFLIKTSNHVVTSTTFLNDHCKSINKFRSCTYISSSIDINRFQPNNNYTNDNIITIGWTGTFSSKIYLEMLKNTFYRLRERCDFKLKVISNFGYELPGIDLEVIKWTKDKEVEDLQGIDIGIYPLYQEEWVLGKSGLKAIQYMAFGLPTVATNYGMVKDIISHLHNGLLVNSEDEWVDSLELLVKQPDLRRQLGECARRTIVNRYSTKVLSEKYLSILETV